ncbi:hypothetical protein Poli38472_005229 [Pythium oligandrum]|uniref:Uncharacterized protein n=1 Tax=Pythium oligandrum TaxID=41045 RepID=A0A8K1FHD8_PYTOL|nr:hypothetical protein Poli38472_005229 [Pythium oligandrum]|eukprot:TMW62611.1 hypothetical protein Poli38472_005229 [Pythium oligandrum]
MQHQQAIISVNVMLAFVFPAYNYVFIRLSPSLQTWFALLFPEIKLVARNAVSPFCYYIEDFKPEVVIFHLEVFHAFFVSISLTSGYHCSCQADRRDPHANPRVSTETSRSPGHLHAAV